MREHAELLSSVRDDITEYKASGSMSPSMQLLRERAAIHGSTAHIDDVISQAQTTRAVLGSQRALLGDVQGKAKLLSDKFPFIHSLLGSIRRRRSRDTFILSAVIAADRILIIEACCGSFFAWHCYSKDLLYRRHCRGAKSSTTTRTLDLSNENRSAKILWLPMNHHS
uniref:Uncharacterized protein MANES_01G268000 n=1 Tax=Rhizophora mucronata TaxID=61149 RepID=A0A2P2KJB3_RHIMU